MKKYIKPFIEIVELGLEDIILTSETLTDGGSEGDFTGGGANAGWGTATTATTSTSSLFD